MEIARAIRYTATASIVVAFTAYLILTFPRTPQDVSRLLDFSEFYAAGQIVRDGNGHRLYDLILQSHYQLHVAPVHAFFLRPPFEAVLFVPFTFLTYRNAYSAWVLLCVLILCVTARLFERNTAVLNAMNEYARGIPVDFGLLFVLCLTFGPTLNCLLIGQDSILILAIYTLVFVALKKGKHLAAGCLLASGLFKFHLVLPFAIVFALRRQWRFLVGFGTIALALALISVLVSGPGILIAYPKMFIDSPYKPLMGFQPEYAANLRGLIYLLSFGKVPAIGVGIVAIISCWMLWLTARSWRDDQFELSFAAAVLAALLTGFHSFIYDLSLLLLPIAIVCGQLATRGELLRHRLLSSLMIVLFLPPVHFLLSSLHVYALMSIALIVFYFLAVRLVRHTSSNEAPLRVRLGA